MARNLKFTPYIIIDVLMHTRQKFRKNLETSGLEYTLGDEWIFYFFVTIREPDRTGSDGHRCAGNPLMHLNNRKRDRRSRHRRRAVVCLAFIRISFKFISNARGNTLRVAVLRPRRVNIHSYIFLCLFLFIFVSSFFLFFFFLHRCETETSQTTRLRLCDPKRI